MPPPPSKLWTNFRKKDGKVAICKLCFREVKYSGNTSNLMKHMKTHHKNVSLEISNIPKSNTKSPKSDSNLDSEASGSVKPSTSSSAIVNSVDEMEFISTNIESNASDISLIKSQPKHILTSPITEALNRATAYAVGGNRHTRLTNTLLYFICKDNRPFAVTEGEGFKKLMHELAPAFKIPSVKFLKQQLIMKYEAISTRFKFKLEKAEHICLSSDVWTETMAEKSYLGVTAHFLEGTNIVSIDLSCKQLNSNHTAQYLSKELESVLVSFNIDKDKVIGIVTDSGANMVAAAQTLLPNKHIPCFAHKLNLVTNAALSLPCIKGTITKVRDIVKFIKNSVINSDMLRKIQLESNIPEGNIKKVILDVKTRWNSTFYMVQRFLELLPVINQILLNGDNNLDMLIAAEIADLRQLENLLKPFECATKEISGEKYITVSKIVPMVNCLSTHLKKFEGTTESITAAKTSLEAEIAKRFGLTEQNSRLAISTLLDPRFKNIHFQNPVACGNAISKLKAACTLNDTTSSGESEEEKTTNNTTTFDFWQTHKELAQCKNKKGKTTDHSELTLYLSNPVSYLKSNPLEVWEDMKTVFPSLYIQARKHLVMMATSVPCERLFSKTGCIINQERNRLSSKYLDYLVFLNSVNNEEWFM